MTAYRKKPVVIEAWKIEHDTEQPEWVKAEFRAETLDWCPSGEGLWINTLEGCMVGSEGDMLIRGVKGEFYPCKPDIFALTYEPATHPQSPASPLPEAAEPVAWATCMRDLIAKLRNGDWSLRSPDELACMVADMLERAIPRIAAPSPVVQAPAQAGEVARLAFEARGGFSKRLLWKRGGSTFAEDIPAENYVDNGVQHEWELWQEAWRAALATQPLAAPVQQEAEAASEPLYLVMAGGDGFQSSIVPESKLDDAYLLTQWFDLNEVSSEDRAETLEHFHEDDNWTHINVTGNGERLEFSLHLEDGWIRVIRLFDTAALATPPAHPVLAPVVREPLTDRQVQKFYAMLPDGQSAYANFVQGFRSAERAHGIQATTGEQSHG